jgi:hypothetical protein
MTKAQSDVLSEIIRISPTLHNAGTFSVATLDAFVRHVSTRSPRHSVETGAGASTLLLSHLSEDHTVFALDGGTGSLRSVQESPLLRREVVTFVEGPSQTTLPAHEFVHPIQLALIDGPHAYPFPELEYYYLYPHLEADALLIVDDIHIPTITHLFDFLRADEMFDLQEVVETTAFFRRTEAPTFFPFGDGWQLQRYNQRAFETSRPVRFEGAPLRRVTFDTPFFLDRFGSMSEPMHRPVGTIAGAAELVVSGWALDARSRRPAAAVDLVMDGVIYRVPVGIPRGDVAAVHGDYSYMRCGFSARFPERFLRAGAHELEMRIVLAGERDYVSAGRVAFTVV